MSCTLFDAAIVGGGPAGCSAAITLAQRGARVVLFEAKTYPHHKVCGEFLSPECSVILDQLGIRLLQGAAPIQVVSITAPDSTNWETHLPDTAWGISRSAFDAALAEHARSLGVEVREGTTVTDVRGSLLTGFHLQTRTTLNREQVRAQIVIATYGKRSVLDRVFKRRFFDEAQPYVALKAHFHGPRLPGRIELHTFPGGYCGMSEIEDGRVNVCLLTQESIFARHNAVEAFVDWMQSVNPCLGRRLSHAEPVGDHWLSIAQVSFARKEIVANDILMAGDAAGLIVPLAGDGIAMALQSGRLAASHSANFLSGKCGAAELRQRYVGDWQRQFDARLRLGRALQAIMLRPRLLSLGLRLLTAAPPVADCLVRHTRDTGLSSQ
jgi:flavin-dependent dehydrogenase